MTAINPNLEVWWDIIICRMKQSLIEIHQQSKLTVLQQSEFILPAQHFSPLNRNIMKLEDTSTPKHRCACLYLQQ